ncbi:hypothetical protein LCGC14_2613500, partial [marine sediment metagenome]
NTIGGTARPLLAANAGLTVQMSGMNNTGFTNGGLKGGMEITENKTLADGAIFTATTRGYTTGIAFYTIATNKNDKSQGQFAADTNTITNLTPEATDLNYGTTSDPNGACNNSKFNIWIDAATDTIKIRNCTGSSYHVTLKSLG